MTKAELQAERLRLARELGQARVQIQDMQAESYAKYDQPAAVAETYQEHRLRIESEQKSIYIFYKEQEELVIDKMTKALMSNEYTDFAQVMSSVEYPRASRAIKSIGTIVFRTFFEDKL